MLAALLVRLFWLALSPAGVVDHGARAGGGRWRIDEEHFRTAMIDDGRGVVRFRDGTPWSVRRTGRELAPELLGTIGKPDVWPSRQRVVAEQGRGGVEEAYDDLLRGTRPGLTGRLEMPDGMPQAAGAPGKTFEIASVPGDDLVTSIDARLQSKAEQLLLEAGVHHGSIVDLAAKSHEILAMASADHRDRSDALTAVAPGSVYKLITAAAAIDSHTVTTGTHFVCDGVVHIPHVSMRCWRAHGPLDIVQAIAQSCDSTFARIGVEMGRVPFERMSERFGLGRTGLDSLAHRTVHADVAVVFRTAGEDAGLLANTAIGQEDVRVTPLQGALLASVIAEDGVYRPARLAIGVSRGGSTHKFAQAKASRACSGFAASVIGTGMWQAVHDPRGTLYALHEFPVAAKSGTAELPDGRVNAWLVGYRLRDGKPTDEFAISVVDEVSWQAHRDLIQLAKGWLGAL